MLFLKHFEHPGYFVLMGTTTLYAGTSGLVLPVPNKTLYPPQFQDKSRLTYYASLFNSIEINSSFYKVPMAATVKKWAGEVPDDFKFTFKLWRDITHNKNLDFKTEDVERFMRVIDGAGDRKGSLLVQFPPGTMVTAVRQLENLLSLIRQADPNKQWHTAVEFRHRSWYNDAVYELMDKYEMGLVIQDMPASATPMVPVMLDFVYLRFHGPAGNYRGSYDDAFLSEYATYIKEWQQEGKTIYAYFNNTMGDALQNVMRLREFVGV